MLDDGGHFSCPYYMMSSHYLVILSLIFPLPCISGQASSTCNLAFSSVKTHETNHSWQFNSKINDTSLHGTENGLATPTNNIKSWKGRSALSRRHHLRNAHGILNIIGWGAFLPIGVIVARNFRKVPLKCDEWYNLHILCQTSGYIIGAVGWAVGLWLGTSSNHHHTLKTHKILGIIIFTFATLQILLALYWQHKREDDYKRYWEMYHQLVGYALIAIIIANIFQGIHNQPHAEKWKWIYVGLLIILGVFASALEILRWVKPTISPSYVI